MRLNQPLLHLLTIAALAGPATSRAEEPSPAKHVLFLGLDVSMNVEDATCPVVDADNASVRIVRNGERQRVSLRLGGDFRTTVVPRVGNSSVVIEDLRDERAYTPGTDPTANALAQQMTMTLAQQDSQQSAEVAMGAASRTVEAASIAQSEGALEAAKTGWANYATGPSSDQLDAAANAMANFDASHAIPVYGTETQGQGLDGTGTGENALALHFTVSSPDPVAKPYGVVRVLYRSPDRPNEQLASIRFMQLPPLGPKPRRVSFLNEGLPAGYTLDRYEVHIYTDGRELPTNLSKNRAELSLDEIQQFLLLSYLAENPEGDAPVQIAGELLDNDLRQFVPPEQMNRAVDVDVDDAGKVTSIALENVPWEGPDAYITSVLKATRFLPAVHRGKPVAGHARFVLSEFLPQGG